MCDNPCCKIARRSAITHKMPAELQFCPSCPACVARLPQNELQWRPVPATDGFEVSNDGRVSRHGVDITPCIHWDLKPKIKIVYMDGRVSLKLLPRLIAEAFVPFSERRLRCKQNNAVVDFKDLDPFNLTASNLYWRRRHPASSPSLRLALKRTRPPKDGSSSATAAGSTDVAAAGADY